MEGYILLGFVLCTSPMLSLIGVFLGVRLAQCIVEDSSSN